jgi:PAS domain S-box-containing protein
MTSYLNRISINVTLKLIILGLSLAFAFGVILLGLLNDVLIITPLLFYIPIIVAAYWFPKKATLFAVSVGGANILIVYFYSYPTIRNLTYTTATASFYVLIALTLVISSLTQKMEAQKARYLGVFTYSDNGMILAEIKDKDLLITEVNARALSLLGSDEDIITGRPLSVVMPEDISRDLIADQIHNEWTLATRETVLRRNNGTTVPVLISGAGAPDGMVILNVTDIRDRKTAEDRLQHSLKEKEILLREVHHRVKNNMQVISGLIELQSSQITDPEIRRLFQETYTRIKTMALIHESLYRSKDYAHLDFSAYLRELVSYLLASYGRSEDEIKVDIQLEVTRLDMDIAIPCGLIANELLSNSLKHAFPPGRRGTISIRLEPSGTDMCDFVVSDNGVGVPPELNISTAKTFGLQLINGLASHQMRGTVDLERGNGTTIRVRFPCKP